MDAISRESANQRISDFFTDNAIPKSGIRDLGNGFPNHRQLHENQWWSLVAANILIFLQAITFFCHFFAFFSSKSGESSLFVFRRRRKKPRHHHRTSRPNTGFHTLSNTNRPSCRLAPIGHWIPSRFRLMAGQMVCRFVAIVAGYGKTNRQARCRTVDETGRKVIWTTWNV